MTVETGVPGARTIERALTVLDSFTAANRRWRTSRLAEHCDLPVPTTHRILRVLESFGYVARDPDSRAYVLGPRAAGLAREEPLLAELRAVGWPTLRALRKATGARVCASALSEARDRRLEAAAIPDALDEDDADADPRGTPLHAGASSKTLLAQLPDDEIAALLQRELEPVGPATVTEAPRLWREVRAVRRRGWAFSREEAAAGTWALAVPVSGSGRDACTLAIGGTLAAFDRRRARHQVTALKLAARALELRLQDEDPQSDREGMSIRAAVSSARRPSAGPTTRSRGEARWQTA
jgi:IclR family transcriptional regulator, acetate operon repressor